MCSLATDTPPRGCLGTRSTSARARSTTSLQWEALAPAAASLQEELQPGSPDWFLVSSFIVASAYARWDTETLERVARVALAAAQSQRVREMMKGMRGRSGRRSGVVSEDLDPLTARSLLEIKLRFSYLLQFRGQHEEALKHLRFAPQDLQAGRPLYGQDAAAAAMTLAAGRSLLVLGRHQQALQVLRSMPDRFGEYREGAVGAVLQATIPGGEYRGLYSGDARHTSLRSLVRQAVAPARERLAAELGWELDRIPPVAVGVADAPRVPRIPLGQVAFTYYDPRMPAFGVVTMFLSQALALDRYDLETILVHEFTHAVLQRALGMTYLDVPLWLTEGLCMALAGQLGLEVEQALQARLAEHGAGFASRQYWQLHPPRIDSYPGSPPDTPGREEPLLVMVLAEASGGDGVRVVIDALLGGASADEALRQATDMDLVAFRVKAVARLREIMQSARDPSMILLFHLLVTMQDAAPREVEEYVREVLQDELPALGRGWAQVTLAAALQEQERFQEAATVWEELVEERRTYPVLFELALQGRATCLLLSGRMEEGRALLQSLTQEAPSMEGRDWAERNLREARRR